MSSNAHKSRLILDRGDAIKKVSHDVVCADHNYLTGQISAGELRTRYHETLTWHLHGLAGLLSMRYPTYEMSQIAVMMLERVGIYTTVRTTDYMGAPTYVLDPWVTTD